MIISAISRSRVGWLATTWVLAGHGFWLIEGVGQVFLHANARFRWQGFWVDRRLWLIGLAWGQLSPLQLASVRCQGFWSAGDMANFSGFHNWPGSSSSQQVWRKRRFSACEDVQFWLGSLWFGRSFVWFSPAVIQVVWRNGAFRLALWFLAGFQLKNVQHHMQRTGRGFRPRPRESGPKWLVQAGSFVRHFPALPLMSAKSEAKRS